MSSYTAAFDIVARDKASDVFDKVGRKVDDSGSKLDKWKGRAKIAAAAAGAAVVAFGADSMRAYADAEKSQRVLEDAYARFPAVQDVPISKMREYAQALQGKTKFDGDEINAMQGKIAAYKLTGTQIQQLTPLILDYAAKTGKDLTTASEDVGKALMGQGRSLKAIGINFKDTGSTAGNFNELMGGLRTQVGGFAEKEGASAEGKLAILKNKFGDLQESIGEKLMPVAEKLTDWLTKAVDWISQNSSWIGALTAVVLTLVAGLKIWSITQAILNMELLANPIGLVVLAVAALAAGIVWVATQTTFFQDAWKMMTDALAAAWRWLWNTIIAPIIRWILNGFASMTEGIAGFLRALGNIPGFGWAKDAADKMDGAARKARDMAKGIKDIPDHASVSVEILVAARATALALKVLSMKPGGAISSKLADIADRRRAHGGPVRPGVFYAVGDNPDGSWNPTTELFEPDVPGTVHSAADSRRIMAGANRRPVEAGSGGTEYLGTVILQLDGREIHRSLLRLKRTEGGRGLELG